MNKDDTTKRATPGHGLGGLKQRARATAEANGHRLSRFGASIRGDSYIARCRRTDGTTCCDFAAVILPRLIDADGRGFGGSAIRARCLVPADRDISQADETVALDEATA